MWLLRSAHVALFPLDDTSERLSCVAWVSENAKRGSAGATNVSESTMQEECSSTSLLSRRPDVVHTPSLLFCAPPLRRRIKLTCAWPIIGPAHH